MEREDALKTGGGSDPAAGFSSGNLASVSRLAGGLEFDLIRRFYAGSSVEARSDVRLGPGDDCAVVSGNGIVLSVDLSIEGVHFRREWLEPFDIGYRAATASLSDLAAMAARPIGVLASIATHERDADEFAVELMRGITAAVTRVGGVLLGGDLARSLSHLVVDVVAVGEANAPVTRGGAKPGDELWVTGELGGSGAAVEKMLAGEKPDPSAFERFRAPKARVEEAQWLAATGCITAMLDLSDGLGGDAGHLATASGVSLRIEAGRLPIHPAARASGDSAAAIRLALSGGEDYEICFTARPGSLQDSVDAFGERFGIPLTRVGMVESGEGVSLMGDDGGVTRLTGGFQHFYAEQ